MIHLNLIEAAERVSILDNVNPVHITDVRAQEKNKKKKLFAFISTAALLVVGFSFFLSSFGVPVSLQGVFPAAYLDLIGAEDPSRTNLVLGAGTTTSAGGLLEAQAIAEKKVLKMRESMTVKQVVGEINPQALFNNKRVNFDSYLPMEKISYQRAALSQFLSFLTTATPDDIGFSDCVFQSPNYYYVRGLSAKATSQRSFLERAKAVSNDFRTPPLPENAPATDITAFGLFNVSAPNLNAVSKFVTTAEVSEEIKALKTLATANKVSFKGFEKPLVEDFGVYKRYSYIVSSISDYPDIQSFVTAMADSPIRLGVQKMEMKFEKKDLQTVMRFVMFVVP